MPRSTRLPQRATIGRVEASDRLARTVTHSSPCEVVIASYLEPELVAQIAAREPRAHVTFEPELLPVPRFPSDHRGAARTLSSAELERWLEITSAAEVMFGFDWYEPAGLPHRCPDLRLIQATFAGVGDFIKRTGLDRSTIEIASAAGIHAVPLAEFALMGALYFVKRVGRLNAFKAERRWQRHATQVLAGRRALVVGLGAIGRQVASTFDALGVEVWGLSRRPREQPPTGVTRVIAHEELGAALHEIDVLVLACALTEQTRGMIAAGELAALPEGAVVINVSRGAIIDEGALISELSRGRLAGACLDVFAEEPLPVESPLWAMDNVIISPHCAANLADENVPLAELFIDNLGRYLDGRPRRNVYDAAAGY